MSELTPGEVRIVNKPGHWAHGSRVNVLRIDEASRIESRSKLVEVAFPDSLGHGSELFEAADLRSPAT